MVVPLDPTTGNRELEMILEAAPLRALVTRPRGGEGVQAAAGLPYYATPPVARPPAGPPSKFAPEIRRRLQGTLLSCNLYKRAPLANLVDEGRDAPAVVQFTASVGGDPEGRGQDRRQPGRGRAGDRQDAGRDATRIASCARCRCTRSYGFDFGLLVALANGTTLFLEDEVSPKRIAKLLREQSIDFFAGNPALYGALVRVPTIKPLKTSGARFLSSGSSLPAEHRRELPRALRRAAALLLPRHAGGAAGGRSRRQGSRDGRQARSRASSCGSPSAKGERLAAGEVGPIWARSKTLSMLSVPKIHLPEARRRRPDRRRRRATAGTAPATSASSTRTAA